jgi:cytoskeletal protein RodZ
MRIIAQLENDELDALPADIFVRGYLRAYARAVSIDEGDVLSRHQRKPEPERPAPLPAVYTPEPGRRFGIALALVILLILFTLALSIVLRPRHRDAPLELSLRAAPCHQLQLSLPSEMMRSSCVASITAKPTASSRC